ncbi:helix-turn-helix domain-containing protein [Dyadobacter arcticus]|uniref:AraC-like DNA-binding protein n=1 Tax=Dyadobacter arcticus TaxID=1078754 RepID=A0ABX0UU61_9BACT|nr:AraC family transcriptional regulator [Dyadobacter arcticus]NIJ54471.1 AraC-like DNA-binding protein [Dyadobacter arcticus]
MKLQPRDTSDEVFLQRAVKLIEDHLTDTDFTVETFVSKIDMGRLQVHRKLKALTDQSTSEFIRSIRLKRAASLLEQGFGNVTEVMYEVGFNHASYFATNFKKMFGINPSDYRQHMITSSGLNASLSIDFDSEASY